MKIILYKTDICPQCRMLATKMKAKNIEFEEVKDTSIMESRGIHSIPTLQVDEQFMDVQAANRWINNWGKLA